MVVGMIFAAPCIAGFAVFFAVPFIISLFYCFTEGISAIGFVGFDNFKGLLESGSFRLAAMNTLKFNLISVPFILMLSLAIALLLNSKLKYISVFLAIILPGVFTSFGVFLLRQFIQGIPDEYSQAARADGAGHLSICFLQY